ncbi:probable folate-biopterin transporter 8, chloroplastic [Impatiens glandulifera]|uniref:probable folate-biopterin transporter 8, chloroplastic n=1 Tax=Impatiens glandulifera TaxID=253017 RepID=UPI001FB05E31|nr:probable folate-biopterin transporter 8, chloroplastic [Impatiens glandulifera]
MNSLFLSCGTSVNPFVQKPPHAYPWRPFLCSNRQEPKNPIGNPSSRARRTNFIKPIKEQQPLHHIPPPTTTTTSTNIMKNRVYEEKTGHWEQMRVLCGLGYCVQGFRGFPWLVLNFHMSHNLHMPPSTLQLVQNLGNLPMVAKPLYGVLSDAVNIGGVGHRIPYILIGVVLQILAWAPLTFIPVAHEALPGLIACVLLSNVGASITEVANDALVAEYGHKHKLTALQSYAFMASAAGGLLGNLLGGYFLQKTQRSNNLFLVFSSLLCAQVLVTLTTREQSLGLSDPSRKERRGSSSLLEIIKGQYGNLTRAVREEKVSRPLTWVVASIGLVPIFSGSIFCYQTQFLNLDPSVIGLSKVTGQLMLLSVTFLYERFWRSIPTRKLVCMVQALYAFSLLLDFILVKQINVKLGIPNKVFVLCFSGLAETIAQFKLLPFFVLFARLAPQGCEGSLTSFLASALCFSSIFSGVLGVGLASLLGITSGDYSMLPIGIVIQSIAALIPLRWIHQLPLSPPVNETEASGRKSVRTRRNWRKVKRMVVGSIYTPKQERESKAR